MDLVQNGGGGGCQHNNQNVYKLNVKLGPLLSVYMEGRGLKGWGKTVVSILHRILFQHLTGRINGVRRCLGRKYLTIHVIYNVSIKIFFIFWIGNSVFMKMKIKPSTLFKIKCCKYQMFDCCKTRFDKVHTQNQSSVTVRLINLLFLVVSSPQLLFNEIPHLH